MIHQIVLVRRAGHAGAVSWRLHSFTLVKDLSTLVFGIAMGLAQGWPLFAMGGIGVVLKVVLLWEMHRSTRGIRLTARSRASNELP